MIAEGFFKRIYRYAPPGPNVIFANFLGSVSRIMSISEAFRSYTTLWPANVRLLAKDLTKALPPPHGPLAALDPNAILIRFSQDKSSANKGDLLNENVS